MKTRKAESLPPKRERPARPQPEQLVFPYELAVGDIVLEDGIRLQVVGRPTATANGKTTRAWVQRDGESVQREAVWEAWRRLRVVRKPAA